VSARTGAARRIAHSRESPTSGSDTSGRSKEKNVPLNRDFIGRSSRGSDVFEVTRDKIREFAVATGHRHPVYLDAAAAKAKGYPDVVAPTTFLTALELRMAADNPLTDREFGLDIRRVVHGGQRFVANRPVVAGDRLVLNTVVEDVRDAGSNELVVLRHDVETEGGEKVASVTVTIVSRGTAAAAGGKEA
jgi:acyl dehydratase